MSSFSVFGKRTKSLSPVPPRYCDGNIAGIVFSQNLRGTGENSVETFEEQKAVNKPGIAPGYRVSLK
jgi:hypothetical protein